MKKSTQQLLTWGGIAAVVGYFLYQKSQGNACGFASGTPAAGKSGAACPNANMGGKNFGVTGSGWCC